MKEGYKLCPFCANEIKEKAIKCQYCGEFLNEKIEEPKIKYRCACGSIVNEGDKICSHCGAKLDWKKTKLNGEKSKENGNNSKFDEILETFGVICLVFIILGIIISFLSEPETSTLTGTGNSNQEVSKTSVNVRNDIKKLHRFELEDENYENDNIEDIILGQGVRRGMTFDEIKKIYGLNKRNITEGFGGVEQYMDLSKYKKISFIDNKGIQVEYQFYYYDNNYRLYKVNNKYNYTANSYNNAKDFLDMKFGTMKEKNLNGCITCKEGFRYNKGGTSAYLLKDYGSNYLDLKDVIDNFQVQYESDSIVNIINREG